MTEDAYITKVIKDNPRVMAAAKIQLTPAALQQALRAAWRAGAKASKWAAGVSFLDNLLRPHHISR